MVLATLYVVFLNLYYITAGAKDAQETANQLMRDALGKVTPDKAAIAEDLFDKVGSVLALHSL